MIEVWSKDSRRYLAGARGAHDQAPELGHD